MIKRIACILCALVFAVGLLPARFAAAALEPERPCSLTLYYTRNGVSFPELEIEIYRVAAFDPSGDYRLLAPFSAYPVRIHAVTSQQEWRDAAQTMRSYIVADGLTADRTKKTDNTGIVKFTDLTPGVYLVRGVTAHSNAVSYAFQDFFIFVPTPKDGNYNYDVEAKPKSAELTPSAQYSVLKLWKDSEDPARRPDSVTVDILKDGVVQESVVLNSANHWSYNWQVQDTGAVWSVVERDVSAAYSVSITNNAAAFVITNTLVPEDPDTPDDPDTPNTPDDPDIPDIPVDPGDPDTPVDPENPDEPGVPGQPGEPDEPAVPEEPAPGVPKTGDTTPIWLYIVTMCISGLGLMVLGLGSRRGGNHEKKR